MTIRITGMNSGLDTEAMITELMSAYRAKGDKYTKAQTKLSWKQDAWKSLNSKIYSLYTSLDNMRLSSRYNLKKCTISDTTKALVTGGQNAMNGTQTLEIRELAKTDYMTGAKLNAAGDGAETKLSDLGITDTSNITINQNGEDHTIEIKGDMTLGEFVKKMNESGADIQASYDTKNQRLYITSKTSGEKGNFELSSDIDLGKLGLSETSAPDPSDLGNVAQRVRGQDAEIYLNEAKYTSETNTFEINGLTIQAQAKTDGEITITTATDTQGLYDKIKDFISDYNDIISEMSSLYNADSAKGYEPLTSDEKSAMSEADVEAWEKKVKDSLLRRDDTLGGLMTAMTQAMLSTVEIDGKKYSLANLGIKTASYFDTTAATRNILHIDGDEDDEKTASNENQLMNMLNSDPDKVIEIFTSITDTLHDSLFDKMKATELSSSLTVYNDKEMAISYSDYTRTIKEWEDKMQKIEDSYYKKFSAMETALAKMQSQQSSLAGLFGTA